MPSFDASGRSPIDSIRLVERFTRAKTHLAFKATSLPGHLLHLVVAGRVEQTCNGRLQQLTPGCIVWYHEDEWVAGQVLHAPWIYYSVNFAAPALAPPDFSTRLLPDRQDLLPDFKSLHTAWQLPPSRERDYRCQARLLDLIAKLHPTEGALPCIAPVGRLWWEVEAWARTQINRTVTLTELCQQFKRSANTVTRASVAAVGLPPMKRLKQIRLSLARGLVHYSELNMTEIAQRIGYARVHEFSRDYRKVNGRSPTADRAAH